MPPKSTPHASSTPVETFNCKLCNQPDIPEMVACDKCDSWFHFECVNVDSAVNDISWMCEGCRLAVNQPSVHSQRENGRAKSTTTSSKSRRRRELLLEKIQEEKKLRDASNQRYLEEKYKILEDCDSSDEDLEIAEGKSVDRSQLTEKWVEGAVTSAVPPNVENKQPHISSHISQKPFVPSQLSNNRMPTHSCTHNVSGVQPALPCSSFVVQQIGSLSASQLAARQAISKDLPLFHGYPEEWPVFISSFEQSTTLAGYSDAENLLRLQKCLRGSALESVKNRLLIPTMVPDIIKTLRMRFGRPEHILHAMIAKAKIQAPPKAERMETLIEYALAIQNVCASIEAANMTAHLNNPTLLKEFVDKLTPHLLLNWALFAKQFQQPTLMDFSQWLSDIADAACSVTTPTIRSSVEKRDTRRNNHLCTHSEVKVQVSDHRNDGNLKCCVCLRDHTLDECFEFKRTGRSERWNIVRKNNLCHTCLKKHPHSRCKVTRSCEMDGCMLKHHPLLHKNEKSNLDKQNHVSINASRQVGAPNLAKQQSGYSTIGCHTGQTEHDHKGNVLFNIVPVTLYGNDRVVDTFAFLDGGSSLTLIDEELANDLALSGKPEVLCLKWTSETTRVEENSKVVALGIRGHSVGCKKYVIRNVRTIKNLGLPTQSISSCTLQNRYPYMRGLPISSYQRALPRILIGMDNWKLGVPAKVFEGSWSEPMVTKCRLGWCVHGPERKDRDEDNGIAPVLAISETDSDTQLHQLVEKYFSIENIGICIPTQQMISAEEKRAVRILEDTCVFYDKHFEVGLLWKFEKFVLPDSYSMAYRRFQLLDRKIKRDFKLRTNISEQISNLVAKGYAKKLSAEELNVTGPVWYLPIFTVTNPNKPAKIRLVWDAAAKCDGVSLNDFLLKGPDQLVPITNVLYGFRCGRVAVCGDIAEMFHQVRVRKADRSVQRFLWKEDESSVEPSVFEMQVLTFGATCSPCIAHHVKNHNAMSFMSTKPRAVKAIIHRHYVDDFIDSTDTVDEAIELAKDVKVIHANAGFHIRNWMSNSTAVLDALQENGDQLNKNKAFGLSEVDITVTEKVLGMHWNTSADVFTFVLNLNRLNQKVLSERRVPTKREVLKILMSIFDPLGFLSHFLVFVKVLLQDIWRTELTWDEELPAPFYERWLRWQVLLPGVTAVQIPRCYSPYINRTDALIQLHTFVDASENAYAAVSYFRIQYRNQTKTTIVSAKTKVAPRRPLSIPRLELQAAVLGVRLMTSICNGHSFSINERFLWSDSKTVLSWLRMEPRNFQQFVMYRVGEILESSKISEWKWIPSKLNIADKATKWDSNLEWKDNDEWFTGPNFLREKQQDWPQMPTIQITNRSEFRHHLLQTNEVCEPVKLVNVKRFGSWRTMVRSLACVIIYINKLKAASKRRSAGKQMLSILDGSIKKRFVVISSTTIKESKILLYRQAQSEEYLEEIQRLSRSVDKEVFMPKSSALAKLSPFLDEYGVLRMRGRIAFADYVDLDCKTPIILPKSHCITQLIVDDYHRKYHHRHQETVLNEIRQQFYIPKLRVLLKSVRRGCQACKIRNARPEVPEMANLPRARLGAFCKPFSFVGIDFFGPISVSVGRRNEKRWGALFTCLTIRAVHIEVAHSLTTDSFSMCLRNFMARRGAPLEIYSDNGTNFRGAERVLREELKNVDLGQVANEFVTENLKWRFNPPSAPHMGGAWERLIRSIKTVLYQILDSKRVGDESLRCTLIEIESVINSRPLTYVSLESDEDEALTPNHFLLGSSNGSKPPCDPQMFDYRKSWKQSQILAEQFWKKWVKAYLPTLNRRSKWFHKVKPISVGDLVIIVDNELPRNCWPKGIVVEVVVAKDGQVRRAKVQTRSGLYDRPAAKLAVLDVGSRQETRSKTDAKADQLTGGGNVSDSCQ